MKSIITYFTKNHLVSNILFVGVFLMAIFAWNQIGKEEMPEFESNWMRVSASYPGAAAEDVELFVTKPIEDELKEVTGIEEIYTTSSTGSSSFRIVIDEDSANYSEVVQNIKDATLRASLPREVDTPTFRQFKSTEKAIIDVGFYLEGERALDYAARKKLQSMVLNFENQIKSLGVVSGIDKKGYDDPELHILIDPDKLNENDLSIDRLVSIIRNNHIRVPLGTLEDKDQSKVTAIHELEDKESLDSLFVVGNYGGKGVRLGEIAHVEPQFKKSTTIRKLQGHEGIVINVKKKFSTDILTAQENVVKFVEEFKRTHSESGLRVVLMDDESYDVKNRLSIVASNGIIGFILIFLVLFVFLDFKSGLWVGMGIPFTLAFAIISMTLVGYTINNMTLAAVIIVMGIVVDDAIVVAENISRKRYLGESPIDAAVNGTHQIITPVFGSILTTCVAFVPLLFFEGFFGKFVEYIPFVIISMLVASLLESTTILPSHLLERKSFFSRFKFLSFNSSWFFKYEEKFSVLLEKCLRWRAAVLLVAVLLSGISGYLFKTKMKFVMFPREEGKEVHIKVIGPKGANRFEMSKMIEPLEEMILRDKKDGVVAVQSTIGESRRGSGVLENQASVNVELVNKDDRELGLNDFIERWEKESQEIKGLTKINFLKSRWGRSSGSALEIQVQENNDKNRDEVTKLIEKYMLEDESLKDVEIEKPLNRREYNFKINQERLVRFNLSPENITTSLRSFVEGAILYTISKGDEDVEVRLTVDDKNKFDLSNLRELKIENNSGGFITLDKVVSIEEYMKPANIQRKDYKRTTIVYGNIKDGVAITPVEVAEKYEAKVFPKIIKDYPSSVITFIGEVKDTRESGGDFVISLIMVIGVIYIILVIMFNSLGAPLLIMAIVPFGLSGVVYALLAHGMYVYGFFAAVGALGMIGVVVNDAIIMISKLEEDISTMEENSLAKIASVSSTRLRPIVVTTLTTVAGVLPTAYGIAGYDSMLAEMMLSMGWGLLLATIVTLFLIPCLYSYFFSVRLFILKKTHIHLEDE
ncbi:efflux RND transporter permease subunit [Halobacteriovorax marinus]|uniref:efflux RND transporter permease subunit n=1 Tax=Halobacteriovorax marinus TaxID=97084 RepID=UPI003A8FC001